MQIAIKRSASLSPSKRTNSFEGLASFDLELRPFHRRSLFLRLQGLERKKSSLTLSLSLSVDGWIVWNLSLHRPNLMVIVYFEERSPHFIDLGKRPSWESCEEGSLLFEATSQKRGAKRNAMGAVGRRFACVECWKQPGEEDGRGGDMFHLCSCWLQ